MTFRRRVHLQLNPAGGFTPLTRFLVALILVATTAAIFETEPTISKGREAAFRAAELGFALLFSAEYLARLWSTPECGKSRLRFVFSPLGIIDLLAIVGSLLPAMGANALILRLLRLLRMIRLASIGPLSRAFRNLEAAVRGSASELLVAGFLCAFVLVFAATLLFWLEGEAQPDGFGSIPRALWWAAVTMTTVGYGDVYPITPIGKLAAAMIAITGIALVAIPTGILAASFIEEARRERSEAEERKGR